MLLDTADLRALRKDFPSLARRRRGKPPIYLNNTCMTLRPKSVIDAISRYYAEFPTCGGGRTEGASGLSNWFMEELRGHEIAAREALRRLVNASRPEEMVWTRNTTEAMNLVAKGLRCRPGDRILLSEREHNSNLVPWTLPNQPNTRSSPWRAMVIVPSGQRPPFSLWPFVMISTKNAPVSE